MKKISIFIIGILGLTLGACNDDFLNRYPKEQITPEGFFKSVEDLKAYTNGFYDDGWILPRDFSNTDYESDNVTTYTMNSEYWNIVWGNTTASNITSGWDSWGSLRKVNLMLQNVSNVSGSPVDVNHYIGIARLARAWFYIKMVQRYSDVPWIDKVLDANDPDVYKVSDPRDVVVGHIMEDLDFAVKNITNNYIGNKTRVNRYVALQLLSRFALYEGTFRKYHPELNLQTTANSFLEKAVEASNAIMESKAFSLTPTPIVDLGGGVNGAPGYRSIFTSLDLSGNSEVIMWRDLQSKFGQGTASDRALDRDLSLSRDLMETFLMADGSRFTEQTGYATKTYADFAVGRDPRLGETFAYPGFKDYQGSEYRARFLLGGYGQIKFYPGGTDYGGAGGNFYGAFVLFRYAETLLDYAEAKAELGTITQDDLDKSVNMLRRRVSLPAIALNVSVDPILAAQYPQVASNGLLLEIRRERRVELACEGFRLQDATRWAAGHLLGKKAQGVYVPALGAYDVTGDGTPDIAILNKAGENGPLGSVSPDGLSIDYLLDETGKRVTFYLSEGDHGYVMRVQDDDLGKHFEDPKFYYRPIPSTQLILNPDLKQQQFWQ